MPYFSILTPNLNSGINLKSCIASLENQSIDYEHLLMDGGSSDGSLEIAENTSTINIISREDLGSHDAFAKGVLAAKGDVLGFLNADDIYLPHVLEKVKKIFEEHHNIGAVCGECIFFQGETKELKFTIKHTNDKDFFSEIALGTPCFNGWFVRRDVAISAGNFNSSIDFSGDRDFLLRVFLSCKVYIWQHPVYGYSMHENSRTMSKNRDFMLLVMHEHLSMIQSYLDKWPLSCEQKKIIDVWKTQSLLGMIIFTCKSGNILNLLVTFFKTFKYDFLWWLRIYILLITKIKMKKLKTRIYGILDVG